MQFKKAICVTEQRRWIDNKYFPALKNPYNNSHIQINKGTLMLS